MQIRRLSPKILNDVTAAVHHALRRTSTVNIPLIAEEVRKKNESENVALEDIELCTLQVAQSMRGIILFDSSEYTARTAVVLEPLEPILRQ